MIEQRAHELLASAMPEGVREVFSDEAGADAAVLQECKEAADLLVRLRLAAYVDEGRTRLALTNPGRYWALNGGYMAFLKEEPVATGGNRSRNPELEQLRLSYMSLRMKTFWWSFGISIASFLMSSFSLYIAWHYGGQLVGR